MKTKYLLILFFTIVSLSGCARMHAGQDVIFGRQALLVDKNETAQYLFPKRGTNKPQLYSTGQLGCSRVSGAMLDEQNILPVDTRKRVRVWSGRFPPIETKTKTSLGFTLG